MDKHGTIPQDLSADAFVVEEEGKECTVSKAVFGDALKESAARLRTVNAATKAIVLISDAEDSCGGGTTGADRLTADNRPSPVVCCR